MHKGGIRFPVKYRGKPLMPMTEVRIKRFIAEGKGKMCFDRKLHIPYFKLFSKPCGKKTQAITLALDPGSVFDGISIVSKQCHHLNIELVQREKKGKTSISHFKKRQANTRQVRRSKLRHRPIRFSNRTSKQLTPTIKANLDFRKWVISKLLEYFPLTKIVIEDVCFNHYKSTKGKSFSHVEQGKTELYKFINDLGLELELFKGYETFRLRINSFGIDPKVKTKDAKDFNAHCIDSFVLACPKMDVADIETGEIFTDENEKSLHQKINFNGLINRKVIFIDKIVKVRRCLTRLRMKYKDKKFYYKLLTGGIKKIVVKLGKSNICRVKPEGEHSNHTKQWEYIDHGRAEKFKCNTAPYGGTRINGKTFFINNEWSNRKIWTI